MDVQAKLYGLFQQYAPEERREFKLELPAGATIEELLKTLKIPFDLDRILLVNGRQSGPKRMLEPGDTIVIFSPLYGG
jgi:molybdopterin converting factor small subunit